MNSHIERATAEGDPARWDSPWFFARHNDPRLWMQLDGHEGVAETGADAEDYWLVGPIPVTASDIDDANGSYLTAGQTQFDTNGGLVGAWEQQQELR